MGEVHTKNTLKKNPFFVVLPSPAVIAAVITAFPWLSPRRRNVSLDVSTERPGPLYHYEHFFSPFFPGNSAEPISIARIPSDPLRPLPRALWAQCDALVRN